MNDNFTVCAVVVTYNRKDLLLECLEGIRKQTRPVDAIYLIDNFSTDGTPQILLEKGYIQQLPPENLNEPWEKEFEIKNLTNGNKIILYYVRMNENTGGAGGFHEGVRRAYEKGYDWLWLMDDDVEPLPEALATQIRYSGISKCIHPLKVNFEGERISWEGYLNPETGLVKHIDNISFKSGKDYININIGCFEGMLINRSIVSKIGYPDKRFFISGDDLIYGFLASLHTKNIYINKECFKRKKKESRNSRIFLFKKRGYPKLILYYSFKNRFLIRKYLEMYGTLNNIKWWITLIRIFLRSLIACLLYDKSLINVIKIFNGIYDGYKQYYNLDRDEFFNLK